MKKIETFIRKLQEISAVLYEEYRQLDDDGIEFCCPLTETIDTLYEFSPFFTVVGIVTSLVLAFHETNVALPLLTR
jgi:hypothetical protein